MKVEDLTIKEARELSAMFGNRPQSHSFVIGEKYLVRCVTHYYTGRLASITDTDLVLDDAAWIADTGRFSQCLTSGSPSEVEPFPGRVIISRGAIVDASVWATALPREVK